MNELPEDLARAFHALDARAARRAARVDPSRVAARVVQRLRAEQAPAWRLPSLSFGSRLSAIGYRLPILAAAAVAVLLAGGVLGRRAAFPVSTAVPVAFQALDSLSQTQLESVLLVAGQVRPVALESFGSSGTSLEDLDERQLQALLQAVQLSDGGAL